MVFDGPVDHIRTRTTWIPLKQQRFRNPKIYNASIVVCELQLLPYPWGNVFGELTLFHLFGNPQAPVAKFFFW